MVDVPKPAEPQGNPYIPTSPDQAGYICEKMAGMNTSMSRLAVPDEQVHWMDGFMPLDDQNCRSLPGIGTTIFTSGGGPTTIVKFCFVTIVQTNYAVLFISDGSMIAVDTSTFAVTLIANPGTILVPAISLIGSAAYGSTYLLIVTAQTDGYFIWDGTTLFKPGDAFPPSGGIIPLGIGGTAINVYQGRIWIANGSTIFFSGPGNLINFSSGIGGGSFTSNDSFLTSRFTQLVSVNGFLYLVADSSINYISGVQTSGSGPPVTTFTNQNADAEVGSPYSDSVITFGRNVFLVNSFGVHVLYGSDAKKVSKPMDGVFTSVPSFGGLQLSSGQAVIFGRRCWCVLVKLVDPVTNLTRQKIMMWDGEKKWWVSEQNTVNPAGVVYIRHEEVGSIITLYGTDGARLYQLFGNPATTLTKTIRSKMWARPGNFMTAKTATMLWACFEYPSAVPSQPITITLETEVAATFQNYVIPAPAGNGFSVAGPIAVTQTGMMLGFTLTTLEADIVINSVQIPSQITQYRG